MHNNPDKDNYIIENILYDSIPTSYNLFPELTGFCMNQKNLESGILSFINNSCIIGNCDFFTMKRNSTYTKLTYMTSSPEALQKTNAIGNIMLLSDLIHLYSPSTELDVSLTAKSITNKNLFDDKFNHKCIINQNENSIIIKNSELSCEHSSYNHPLCILQKEQVDNIKKSVFGSELFSSSILEIICDIIYSKKISEQSEVLKILCDILKVSRWTLNRRLKNEEKNFKDIFLDAKTQISIKLLTENKFIYTGD